ncbi:hypothetical protein RZS08_37300, partial [Arthrospira platensis SPKY1]|nr:hypothetical protein [Arthrospira platensis SPKY1]
MPRPSSSTKARPHSPSLCTRRAARPRARWSARAAVEGRVRRIPARAWTGPALSRLWMACSLAWAS